jgi:hypothetical protein
MNLISCDNCGVVLDADKLDFPIFHTVATDEYVWCSERREWVATVPCPVCKAKILSPDR